MAETCGAGAIYMNDCPIAMFIPIYLVVSGAISTCISLTCMIQIVVMSTGKSETASAGFLICAYLCEGVVGFFITIWFFVGKSSLMMRRISKIEPDIAIF